MSKRVLLITTTNLFSNPRLVKELSYFTEKEFSITAITFKIGIGDLESSIIEGNFKNVEFIHLSALKSPLISWIFSSFINKTALLLWSLLKNNLLLSAYASNKRSYLIKKHLDKSNIHYNLIVAHTLGALFPAYCYSKKNYNIPFSFDMEDYHPGELIKKDEHDEKSRRELLLKTILPKCYYITFASPLFRNELEKMLTKQLKKTIVIHNGFNQHDFTFIPTSTNKEKIKLIWYSLTIAEGRGLEKVLPIIAKHSNKVHLTLIGNLTPDFDKKHQISSSSFISQLGYLSQEELHQVLCKSDIGLALEQVDTDLNRNLCLTNKIISYCQAGIYIFASDTLAQKDLITNYPEFGIISTNFNQDFIVLIETINEIRANKNIRFDLGKQFSWEIEQKKLDEFIQHV